MVQRLHIGLASLSHQSESDYSPSSAAARSKERPNIFLLTRRSSKETI